MPTVREIDKTLEVMGMLLEAHLDFEVQLDRPADRRLFITVLLPSQVDLTEVGAIQKHVQDHRGLSKMEEGKLTLIWNLVDNDGEG